MKYKRLRISSFQKIIAGFLILILLGALLLSLPISSKSGKSTAFDDALFTSTSAACVTGLIVYDTSSHWSSFGLAVILTLIQIGGLGVLTVILVMLMVLGKRIGLAQRSAMQDAISAHKVGGIVRYTRFIISATVIFEISGAVFLSFAFCPKFGLLNGIWYSFFHSVSAFCNAGFDLMDGEYTSFTSKVADPYINMVLILLIVFGGLGFLTWQDFKKHKFRFTRYSFQSKAIIVFSAVLIIVPAVYLFFTEYSSRTITERTLSSLFQSVTMRTAGFNTTDLANTSDVTKLMMIGLMLVGGSPGSTAGGMKTTTLAVLVAAALAVFKRRDATQMFKRRIEDSTVRHALAILMLYVFLFIVSGCVIHHIEDIPLIDCLFETASAIGTVGITVGITPLLSDVSRTILMCLMLFGRVGGLTLIYATLKGAKNTSSKLPSEKIIVG